MGPQVALINRVDELAALSSLLDDAETGKSAALVLRGEVGVGKTALLDAVTELASGRGMATAAIAGIEDEAPIGWAALHRVLQRFPGSIDRLPPPQRDALRSTLGLMTGPPPDRFLVGLGVLTLLADRASERPLVTVIDDAQWLDPESGTVFGFAARRLEAEAVVMLFAVREAADRPPWMSRLPELAIGRLGDGDAASLLRDVTGGRLNPARRSPAPSGVCRQSAGARGDGPAVDTRTARRRRRRSRPASAGRLDPAVVRSPHRATGAWSAAVARCRRGGADRVRKRGVGRWHDGWGSTPTVSSRSLIASSASATSCSSAIRCVRSLAYYGMPASERRTVHRALAREMDSAETADRAAWHLAMAATAPDEAVARQLEQAAQRARHRGGYAATTTFLQRAAALSVDEHRRADRLLAAAEAALNAARPDQARALLDEVRHLQTDERQAADALRLSGEAFFATAAIDDAARELLAAAKALMPLQPTLARRTLLTSLIAASWAPTEVLEEVCKFAATIAEAHLSVDALHNVPDLFLFGFLHRQAGDAELAAQLLRKALTGLEHPETSDDMRVAIPPIVPLMAGVELLGENFGFVTGSSYADFARRTGALTVLPGALVALARVHVGQGRFADAEVELTEVAQLVRATGAPGSPDISAELKLFVLCWRGDEAGALAVADALGCGGGTARTGVRSGVGGPRGARLEQGAVPAGIRTPRTHHEAGPSRLRRAGADGLHRGRGSVRRAHRRHDRPRPSGHAGNSGSDPIGTRPSGPLAGLARRRRRRATASRGDHARYAKRTRQPIWREATSRSGSGCGASVDAAKHGPS